MVLLAMPLTPLTTFSQSPLYVLHHDAPVTCLAVSSNGRLIAVGCSGDAGKPGSIILWDATTGKQVRKALRVNYRANSFNRSVDGSHNSIRHESAMV
jgi:WD40 repeat protein